MSAIAGLFYRNGQPARRHELEQMLGSMAYRGPDGRATMLMGASGVGALLLDTSGRRNSPAPLVSRGPLLLAADARLDNRNDLAEQLGLTPRDLTGASDPALVLLAYEQWGEQSAARLLGDFAFAIWDETRQRFYCARDHLGVKQLTFFCSPRLFAFSTELRALLRLPQAPHELNESHLAQLLQGQVNDQQSTLYKGIMRLAAGSFITVDAQQVQERAYWTLDPQRELRLKNRGEYVAGYRELLTEAVRCRLPESGAAGAALSGGLDSSSLVCVARELLASDPSRPLHTFSCLHDQAPGSDERFYIEAMLQQGGVTPHYSFPDSLSPLTCSSEAQWQEDEILWAPTMPSVWARNALAASSGVRVMLEGLAGDLVVGTGSGYLDGLAQRGRWAQLLYEAAWLGWRSGTGPWPIFWPRLRRRMPEQLRGVVGKIRHRADHEAAAARVPFLPAFARRIGLTDQQNGATDRVVFSSMREEQYTRLQSPHLPALTLALTDRVLGRLGVEARYPFLDRRLVEYCLALPPELRVWRGWTRSIAREALAGWLPAEVQRRMSKTRQTDAFLHGLLRHDHALLRNALMDAPGPLSRYLDMATVEKQFKRFISAPNYADGYNLWRFASLGVWLRRREQAASTEEAAG